MITGRLLLILSVLAVGCIEKRTPDDDEPQPTAEPAPQPTAEPAPQPTVEPAPQPTVEPAPQPTPEPEPQGRIPLKHRPVAEACDQSRAPGVTPDEGGQYSCWEDSDCQEGHNGRCIGNGHDGWYCTYDRCFADDGCDEGVCQCGGGFRSDHNVCLGGNCRINADCGPGGYCSPSFGDCGDYFGVEAYYCHTAEDECIDDEDCGDGDGWGSYCAFNPGRGLWSCSDSQCAGK